MTAVNLGLSVFCLLAWQNKQTVVSRGSIVVCTLRCPVFTWLTGRLQDLQRALLWVPEDTCCVFSGVRLQTVHLPVTKTTSCCFGGPDYSDLYVTSASLGLDQSEKRQQSLAGDIFRVRLSQQLTYLQIFHWLICVQCYTECVCVCVYRLQDLGLKVVLQTLSLGDLQESPKARSPGGCVQQFDWLILTV